MRIDIKGRERETGEEKKKGKGDALSAPQIAVYVSRGVGYGNLLTDSQRRRGGVGGKYRSLNREIGRNIRLT